LSPLAPTLRAAGAAVVAALAVATAAAQGTAAPPLPAQLSPRLAACAACHGADGHATLPDVPHLAGQPRLFLENRLVMIREGLSVVPTMKGLLDGLSDEDLIALSRHYAAMPLRPERAARDAARAARGQAVSQRMNCGGCHLPDYRGQEQVPRVAGQREDYLLKSMRDFAAGRTGGRDTAMTNALLGLGDADLADLAHHLATLPASR
jgi:cytochrome c553